MAANHIARIIANPVAKIIANPASAWMPANTQ
jgi:hypothetical protein